LLNKSGRESLPEKEAFSGRKDIHISTEVIPEWAIYATIGCCMLLLLLKLGLIY